MNGQPNVFFYTGPGGAEVPHDVVHLRVDPSVVSIPASAFNERNKLAEVELCEGLVEIGEESFKWCDHSITKINIPTSLRRINDFAFMSSLRTPISLHDDIESIGDGAFDSCIFTNFRVPPLITVIPNGILYKCKALFSIEFSENMTEINLEHSHIVSVYEMWPFLPTLSSAIKSLLEQEHKGCTRIFSISLVRMQQ